MVPKVKATNFGMKYQIFNGLRFGKLFPDDDKVSRLSSNVYLQVMSFLAKSTFSRVQSMEQELSLRIYLTLPSKSTLCSHILSQNYARVWRRHANV